MPRLNETCRTCRYWDQRYPENRDLGVCRKMGVLLWPLAAEAGIVLSDDVGDDIVVTSDVMAVRTMADYGCVRHTRTGTWITTREMEQAKQGAREA